MGGRKLATTDEKWMRLALKLAEKGFTPPNPMVGCVLVRNGVLVGQGLCPMAGQPHAEVFALRYAGLLATGSTAYVTLEPHNYHGKTPPCTDALIRAGVARVVVATLDTNPRINGQGMAQLREAGIETLVGVLEHEARRLNEAFFHFHEHGTPFTTLKAAMTLDGKIATRSGHSQWVTSQKARDFSHLLRARSGAVMVGVNTLLADDPALTARLSPASPRQPLRIIVDSRLRTPSESQAVSLSNLQTPLLIATSQNSNSENETLLKRSGVEVLRLPETSQGRVSLPALMKELASRGVISVLVDGGGELHASLLKEGLANKILFFIAPKIAGGATSPTAVGGEGVSLMTDAYQVQRLTTKRLGPDILLEGYLPNKDMR